jgi:hypothetical protein
MAASPARLHAQFSTLEYLDQIPASAIERWSPAEREAAERWANARDRWTSDVSDYPLPEPPPVLRPYLPIDWR